MVTTTTLAMMMVLPTYSHEMMMMMMMMVTTTTTLAMMMVLLTKPALRLAFIVMTMITLRPVHPNLRGHFESSLGITSAGESVTAPAKN